MDKQRIHCMLETLTQWCEAELAKGVTSVDTKEMGEAIDMVKDLAEAEKAVWEKCYYEKIVEAMEEEEEEMKKEGRAGYDRWRTSRGRFAPKGTGHETSMAMATGRAGYPGDPRIINDEHGMLPYFYPEIDTVGAAGYSIDPNRSNTGRTDGRTSMGSMQSGGAAARMGYPGDPMDRPIKGSKGERYENYSEARRHYQEQKDGTSKQMMTDHAKEYVSEAMDTMKDIFVEADPELQKKMRDDLFRLYREFGGKV